MNDLEEEYEQRRKLAYYTIVIDSRDRLFGTGGVTNFLVQFQPQMTRVASVELQYCFLPFVFSNVTTTYGNQFSFTLANTAAVNGTFAVTIPNGFYSLAQMVAIANTELVAVFENLAGGPYACPITFALSEVTNRVYMTYNSSPPFNQAAGTPIAITFTPAAKGLNGIAPNYFFTMLGLDATTTTLFTVPSAKISTVFTFPLAATAQLPINGVIINIVGLPSKVLTSSQRTGQFYIGVTAANLNGQHVALPNTFKVNSTFFNSVFLEDNYFAFSQLQVYLTDNNGNSLDPDQNPTDWNMSMLVTTYK
jgi:hypothetical protein